MVAQRNPAFRAARLPQWTIQGIRTIDMQHQYMDIEELRQYLGLDQRRLSKMAQRGDIPCQRVGGSYRFNRAEVTEWLQQQIGSDKHDWSSMDAGVGAHRQTGPDDLLIAPMLHEVGVDLSLKARTKASVLRELVALAQLTQRLYDPQALLEALQRREELCPTALENGIAIPHPRRPQPYAISEPLMVVAHVPQGIGFGAPDGRLTHYFFMTCSQDDRHHLQTIARLCRIFSQKNFLVELHDATTPAELIEQLKLRELTLLASD